MPMTRKLAGALAFSAALAAGGVAGALLGTPSISGAQETPTTDAPTTDSETPAPSPDGRPDGHRGPGRFLHPSLEVVAAQSGITVEELRTELADGSTIAELAADRGLDLDGIIAAVVADATSRIDEAVAAGDLEAERAEEIKADLTEHVTAFVNGERRGPGGPGGHGPGGHGFGRGHQLDAAATAIGITADELRTELEGGATVAEVAAAHGVEVQTVIDAMVTEATENLTERITAFVNGE
ncbi:MAG: hypothetical protein H0W25_17290 [Acidimicrobiia bacterium]|nr:hypothetical protein [Acidimicrobiia bacterium]